MMKKTTLALITALVATSIASPVFAQSYNPGDGTGNALPFAFGPGGIKQRSVAVPPAGLTVGSEQLAARNSGRHLYAFVPSADRRHLYAVVPSADPMATPNDPAVTGGGSAGYNAMLLIH
jgi:hypothetical protein